MMCRSIACALVFMLCLGCARSAPDRAPVEKAKSLANNQESSRIVFDAPAGPNCESNLAELAQRGRTLFNTKAACWGCHGRNADGKTNVDPGVEKMLPKPTDLRNAAALRFTSDSDRYDVIRNGIPKTAMVPFRGSLYDHEIRLIVEYLEVLRNGGC